MTRRCTDSCPRPRGSFRGWCSTRTPSRSTWRAPRWSGSGSICSSSRVCPGDRVESTSVRWRWTRPPSSSYNPQPTSASWCCPRDTRSYQVRGERWEILSSEDCCCCCVKPILKFNWQLGIPNRIQFFSISICYSGCMNNITPSSLRTQADNLPARGQGQHQLHLRLQLPGGAPQLAPQLEAGGQVDGDLVHQQPRHRRPGERHPRPQLPGAPRALPGPGAGAVGHLQGGHAQHPRHGDTHGADPAARQPGREVSTDKWSARGRLSMINAFYAGWDTIRGAGRRPVRDHASGSGQWRWCLVWWLWSSLEWHCRVYSIVMPSQLLLSLGQVDLFGLVVRTTKITHFPKTCYNFIDFWIYYKIGVLPS